MNVYRITFEAKCPVDAARIRYRLEIRSCERLMAEDIVAACDCPKPVLHETLADALHKRFGGEQRMIALHGGVEIETVRP